MKVLKKIIAVFSCIAILFSLSFSVSAVDDTSTYQEIKDFYGWAANFNPGGMFGDGFGASRDDYDTYVSDLPASGLGSDGYLYWYPSHKDAYFICYASSYNKSLHYCSHSLETSSSTLYANVIWNCDNFSVSIYPVSGSETVGSKNSPLCVSFNSVVPVSGYYERLRGEQYHYVLGSGDSFTSYWSATSETYYDSGSDLNLNFTSSNYGFSSLILNWYSPVYRFRPLSGVIDPVGDTTYNINTRPTSITGDYGIIGDDGQIVKVDGNILVDESTSTVYNPVTNTTSNMTSWTYDYSDRSYHVTLDDGTTQVITYGDENVTIQEGDTVYNVYYVMQNTPTDPGTCEHTYTSSVTTAPTCTASGLETFTCSQCGNTYTQRIAAMGHTWTVKQTVQTEYDESGNLVTQGFTIYQCSVCGEEYKDTSGSGPPSAPSQEEEVTKEGFFGWLWGILKSLITSVVGGIVNIFDFFFAADASPDGDFYNSPSTFSGVSVWA